jgi:hypothetical protein
LLPKERPREALIDIAPKAEDSTDLALSMGQRQCRDWSLRQDLANGQNYPDSQNANRCYLWSLIDFLLQTLRKIFIDKIEVKARTVLNLQQAADKRSSRNPI